MREVLEHYESQTEEEAVAEDEAAFRKRDHTVMIVPKGLVPMITKLVAQKETSASRGRPTKHKRARSLRSNGGVCGAAVFLR